MKRTRGVKMAKIAKDQLVGHLIKFEQSVSNFVEYLKCKEVKVKGDFIGMAKIDEEK